MTRRISLTAQAHSIAQQYLTLGDIAIDATVGNGYDTVFLVKQVGNRGKVFGFDIQQQAIESTRSRLKSENNTNNLQLFHSSHHKIEQIIPIAFHGRIKVIMFNLGYLPGSDKSIITQTVSTINALEQSIKLMAKLGVITITVYPGHTGGDMEALAIMQWSEVLVNGGKYSVETIYSSDKESAPRLYIIKRMQLFTP